MDEIEIPDIPVTINNDLERQVADAFSLFDTTDTNTIDAKDVGVVIRALGCCPCEQEVNEFIVECEDAAIPAGLIHLSKFLPVICSKLAEHKYEPTPPEGLMEAFHILDEEGKGYITKQSMIELMTTYGEAFSQDELDELLDVAVDPLTQTIPYEYYLNKIMFVPKVNCYELADFIEATKPRPEKKKRFTLVLDEFE